MRGVLSILLAVVWFNSGAQVTFQKTYGSHYFERASRIIQTYDSSYVVVGSSGLTYGSSDAYVLKVDSLGNYLWSKYVGGPNQEHGTDIVETPDSGLAICGYTSSAGNGGYDAYLIKLDKNGELEWEQTYGGYDWDFANALILMPDSGFTLIGETYSFGVGNGDVYLIRTDKFGQVLWENSYGTNGHDVGKDITLNVAGNGYVSVATTDGRGKGMDDIWAAQLNLQGDTLFTSTIGDTLNDDVSEIGILFGQYNLIGTAGAGIFGGSDMFLARIDDNLDTTLTAYFGGSFDETGTGMAIRPPGDHILVGDINTTNGLNQYLSYYTSFEGLFLHSYVEGGFQEEHCTDAAYTYDDSFILCGTTESYGVGATDIYLIKMGRHPDFITSNTIDSEFNDFTSAEPIQKNPDLTIYPNPARDFIQIDGLDMRGCTVRFFNVQGELCLVRKTLNNMVDLSDLPSGYYTLEIVDSDSKSDFRKLMVE